MAVRNNVKKAEQLRRVIFKPSGEIYFDFAGDRKPTLITVPTNNIAGNTVSDAIITPTVGDDGKVIGWVDVNQQYEFITVGGGGGDVTKVGTPVNNQLGVWTGDGTIEGDSEITYNSGLLNVSRSQSVTIGANTTGTTFEAILKTSFIAQSLIMKTNGATRTGNTLGTARAGQNEIFANEVIKLYTSTSHDIILGTNNAVSTTIDGTTQDWDFNGNKVSNINDLQILIADASTNTVLTPFALTRESTGTPANGIGVGISFDVETTVANVERLGIIEISASDVTAASEDGQFSLKLMKAGAAATEVLGITSNGDATFSGGVSIAGLLNLSASTELTIASGIITVIKSYHTVDTESDASTDDLITINGGVEGDILVLRAAVGSRTVVLKDNTDNLRIAGDFSLDNPQDSITIMFEGANWIELSRSDNGA